jgi:hypothetical protein
VHNNTFASTMVASLLHLHLMHCTMLISTHLCAYATDHMESEPEIKKEQVQGVFRGPQVSSCEDANIVVIMASPGASNPFIEFFFFVSYL